MKQRKATICRVSLSSEHCFHVIFNFCANNYQYKLNLISVSNSVKKYLPSMENLHVPEPNRKNINKFKCLNFQLTASREIYKIALVLFLN